MGRNFALEGQQAADKRRYLGWVLPGLFLLPPLSIAIPILQRLTAAPPDPPPRVLEEGPTGAAEQQVFIAAYVSRAQTRRRRKAWLGFALSFWLPALLSVGALIESLVARPGDRQSDVGTQPAVEQNVGAGGDELRGTAAAMQAERRRYAEEAIAREAELREQLPARIEALEELYDTLAETHEAVARVLVDEWEQQWARDRATMAQVTKEQVLGNIEGTREFQGLESAFGIADSEYRNAEQELADAREQLAQAQAAAAVAR